MSSVSRLLKRQQIPFPTPLPTLVLPGFVAMLCVVIVLAHVVSRFSQAAEGVNQLQGMHIIKFAASSGEHCPQVLCHYQYCHFQPFTARWSCMRRDISFWLPWLQLQSDTRITEQRIACQERDFIPRVRCGSSLLYSVSDAFWTVFSIHFCNLFLVASSVAWLGFFEGFCLVYASYGEFVGHSVVAWVYTRQSISQLLDIY